MQAVVAEPLVPGGVPILKGLVALSMVYESLLKPPFVHAAGTSDTGRV